MFRSLLFLITASVLVLSLSFCAKMKKEVPPSETPLTEPGEGYKKEAPMLAPAPEKTKLDELGGITPSATTEPTTKIPSSDVYVSPVERKIILTANINIEVKNAFTTKDEAVKLVKSKGGWVEGQNLVRNEWTDAALFTLTFKVPPEKFEETVDGLSKLGKEKSRQITSEDVTLRHADLEARISNSRAYEARLLEIAKMSGSIRDLLEVEAQISGVREQIETMTAELRVLKELETYSTINLTLSEPQPGRSWVFLRDVGKMFSGGFAALVKIIIYITIVLIILIPIIVIGFLIFRLMVIIIRFIMRGKKKEEKKT
ncbi:MAG: DUF4349 domain-containing protein [bacterium]